MKNNPLSFSVNLKINRNQNQILSFDYWIVLSVIALCFVGLAMIYSASNSLEMTIRQGIYLFVGLVGMFFLAFSNFRQMEVFYLHSFWPALFLLVIVLFFPSENSETKRWIDLGLFTFQPSELIRFILPISAASFLTRNLKTEMKDMWLVILLTFLCFYLVAIQPDLGTSLIVLLAGMLPVIISGFPWVYIYSGAFLGILSLPIIWLNLYEYQKQRVLTLFNPEADIYGAGWNIVQSKIAVGSGGLFGKGFLNGSQSQLNFIPESHSDFIFSVIAEEFGLVGVCMLLFVYGILIFRLLLVAFRSTNRFAKIVSGTLSIVLLAYISINISMVIGILPVVGMPLPFLSQGGTALIVNLLTIGIILSLRKEV